MTREKLDELLTQWAARHAADDRHTQKLADRIVDRLSREDPPGLYVTTERRAPSAPRRKWAYAAIAASAVLLLVATALLVSYLSGRNGERSPGNDGNQVVTPTPAELGAATLLAATKVAPPEIEAGARLFREMEILFADDLRWVADSDSKVRLGVHQVSGGQVAGATPLLIRVLLVQRRPGETSWRKILETDVLTRTQERVEAVPDPELDNRLTLWAHVLPDGKVAVDSSIRLTSPIHASVDVTNVLTPGQPRRVFSLKTEDGEYRLFQVVAPLPTPGDAPC